MYRTNQANQCYWRGKERACDTPETQKNKAHAANANDDASHATVHRTGPSAGFPQLTGGHPARRESAVPGAVPSRRGLWP